MEVMISNILVISIAIILGITIIRWMKKSKGNDKCMNCGKATPVNGLCPRCHYNERAQKLES